MKAAILLVAALASACSGKSSPTAPPSVPMPSTVTFSGRLTATNGGQALSEQAVAFASQTGITDASGRFSLAVHPTTAALVFSGTGIVTRSLTFNVGMPRDVSADAILMDGQFDQAFYRSFVRNAYATPDQLQPLRRLTRAPIVYVQTVDEAGRPIDATTLRTVIDAVWSVGSMWTGGQFGIQDVLSGTEDHTGQAGYLTVKWAPLNNLCGQSNVGLDGGVITLDTTATCGCNGSRMRPRTVRHELGHAFGFWHTGDVGDLMSGLSVNFCDQALSARELYHSAIAYRRPVGNIDPDSDPVSTVNLAPMRVH